MEKFVRIISQSACTQRQYTDKGGQPTVFNFVDFILTDGIDTFFAQATGNLAMALQPLAQDELHHVQCHISHRTFQRQDGTTGHENPIYIDRIS